MAAVQLRGKLRLLEISQLPDIAARKLVPSSRQLPHIVVWKCMEALGSPLPDTNSPPYLEYAGILWNHMEYHKWIPLDVGCNFLMVPSTPTTRSLSSLPFQMSWQIATGYFILICGHSGASLGWHLRLIHIYIICLFCLARYLFGRHLLFCSASGHHIPILSLAFTLCSIFTWYVWTLKPLKSLNGARTCTFQALEEAGVARATEERQSGDGFDPW
jgi:hypothetical protein